MMTLEAHEPARKIHERIWRQPRLLDPRVRYAWIVGAVMSVLTLCVLVLIVEASMLRNLANWALPIGSMTGLAFLLFGALRLAHVFAAYGVFSYELREEALVVTSGVIWRTRRYIPRSRIQHVDIQSGPVTRALGLVELSVYVAGNLGSVAELPGLAPEEAEQLKEALVVEQNESL